jgi:hypothetical protein
MAFVPIASGEIEVGKAVKKELFQKIKDNLDDLDFRVAALGASSGIIEVFNVSISNASSASSLTGLIDYRAPINFSLAQVRLEIYETGSLSSGLLEIDILKGPSPDTAGLTSIFTTLPSINFATAADYDFSNGVLDSTQQAVTAGEFLRLDITSLPAQTLGSFRVLAYGVVA